jgi:hypothetical protein
MAETAWLHKARSRLSQRYQEWELPYTTAQTQNPLYLTRLIPIRTGHEDFARY